MVKRFKFFPAVLTLIFSTACIITTKQGVCEFDLESEGIDKNFPFMCVMAFAAKNPRSLRGAEGLDLLCAAELAEIENCRKQDDTLPGIYFRM